MNLKQLAGATLAASAIAVASPASAFTITNADGTFTNWGGFDWASAGSAWVDGFGAGPTFQLEFMSNAVALQTPGGANFLPAATPGLGSTYEYTIRATITEAVTALIPLGGGVTLATFQILSGTWDVYYDTAANSNLATGVGFSDGVRILGGNFFAGQIGTFIANGAAPTGTGSGINAVLGNVTFTDLTFIQPELEGTSSATTLQYGQNLTAWTRPASFDGLAGYPAVDNAASFVMQADANQSFSVPEPATLALLGLGLLGFGALRRRDA